MCLIYQNTNNFPSIFTKKLWNVTSLPKTILYCTRHSPFKLTSLACRKGGWHEMWLLFGRRIPFHKDIKNLVSFLSLGQSVAHYYLFLVHWVSTFSELKTGLRLSLSFNTSYGMTWDCHKQVNAMIGFFCLDGSSLHFVCNSVLFFKISFISEELCCTDCWYSLSSSESSSAAILCCLTRSYWSSSVDNSECSSTSFSTLLLSLCQPLLDFAVSIITGSTEGWSSSAQLSKSLSCIIIGHSLSQADLNVLKETLAQDFSVNPTQERM